MILTLRAVVTCVLVQAAWTGWSSAQEHMPVQPLTRGDMLQVSDLSAHMHSLKRLLDFALENQNDVDITFTVGIFLVKVNLKWALIHKYNSLPEIIKQNLMILILKSERLLEIFRRKTDVRAQPRHSILKQIFSLFDNDVSWVLGLKSLSSPRELDPSTGHQTRRRYNDTSAYHEYTSAVFQYGLIKPTPKQSDMCLQSISMNPINMEPARSKCDTNKTCVHLLTHGSQYGYALTHRLLWLLAARLARGCSMLSAAEDAALTTSFCSVMYDEADYIAAHDFELSDLLFEQISLCSLDGHRRFFRRHWMMKLLKFQTHHGCFRQMPYSERRSRYLLKAAPAMKSEKLPFLVLGGACDTHVTSVAAGAVAGAVRYVLEEFF